MRQKTKKRIEVCNFCGKKYKKSAGHHCSGKKAYNNGCKKVILNLDKLMFYDPEEDDMTIELSIWKDFKENYIRNYNKA